MTSNKETEGQKHKKFLREEKKKSKEEEKKRKGQPKSKEPVIR